MPSEFTLSAPIKVYDELALRRAAILVVHVILFHRIAGNITAGSLVVDGDVEVPFIAGPAVCRMINAKADEVVRAARASHNGSGEIRVSLYQTAPHISLQSPSKDLGRGFPSRPTPDTAAYTNAWLAHAFAGGMGGAGGAHYTDFPPDTPAHQAGSHSARQGSDQGPQEAELETWRIPFVLLDGNVSATEARSQRLAVQVRSFLSEVLAYVDAQPGLPLQLESGEKAYSQARTSWRICVAGSDTEAGG